MHWNQKYQEYEGRGIYNPQNFRGVHYDMFVRACVINANIGQCPFCSVRLSQQDMYPQGRATRHLCGRCYQAIFQPVHPNCIICGNQLGYKVDLQRHNWRQIENHICGNDLCNALWALGHGIVLGLSPWQSGWNFYVHKGDINSMQGPPVDSVQAQAQQMYQQGQSGPPPNAIPAPQQQQLPSAQPKQIEAVPIGDIRNQQAIPHQHDSYALPHMQANTIDTFFDHGGDSWADKLDLQKVARRFFRGRS